jgi:hypothetical protein
MRLCKVLQRLNKKTPIPEAIIRLAAHVQSPSTTTHLSSSGSGAGAGLGLTGGLLTLIQQCLSSDIELSTTFSCTDRCGITAAGATFSGRKRRGIAGRLCVLVPEHRAAMERHLVSSAIPPSSSGVTFLLFSTYSSRNPSKSTRSSSRLSIEHTHSSPDTCCAHPMGTCPASDSLTASSWAAACSCAASASSALRPLGVGLQHCHGVQIVLEPLPDIPPTTQWRVSCTNCTGAYAGAAVCVANSTVQHHQGSHGIPEITLAPARRPREFTSRSASLAA